MKLVGFISRDMYHKQTKTMISPELKKYTLPLSEISSLDIGREVSYNEETNEVVLETLKNKGRREQALFLIEKDENKPIISVDVEREKED